MRHGVNGLVKETPDVVDLSKISDTNLKLIARTPSAALGSSRATAIRIACSPRIWCSAGTGLPAQGVPGSRDGSVPSAATNSRR